MDRNLIVGIVLGIALTIAAFVAVVAAQRGAAPPPPPPPPAVEEPPPPPEPLITAEEYEEIKLGMPYWKVSDIIGDLEDDRYTEDRPGSEFVKPTVIEWCTWRNPDGSSATVGFDLDRVIEKSQSGELPSVPQDPL